MLDQLNIYGQTKLEVTIKRLKGFEPPEGYYLAFSGGKDSVVVKELANMAGVKYDAHYCVTSVDPPEQVQFIKKYHPDVYIDLPRRKDGSVITMWNLIPEKKIPPTRMVRYCCDKLKEHGGDGRFVLTGVRHAESSRRKNRGGLEAQIEPTGKHRAVLDPDNPDNEELVRICPTKGKHILNPIIDWEDAEVWEFIKRFNIPYCKLYDEGFKRLGCIGCPLSDNQLRDFERWPKYEVMYRKAFQRMLDNHEYKKDWETVDDVFKWFTRGSK